MGPEKGRTSCRRAQPQEACPRDQDSRTVDPMLPRSRDPVVLWSCGPVVSLIIVGNLGSNVKEYKDWLSRYEAGDEEARRALPRKCPKCRRRMQGHGWYWRKIGVKIRRLRCPKCRRSHGILPWFLAPHRPWLMVLIDRAFRLRLSGYSWYQLADTIKQASLSTVQRWIRRIRDLADKVVAILSRDARRLDPELDLDTLLRPFTPDRLNLLDAAIAAFWLACRRIDPDLDFPVSRPLAWCNVYLSTAVPATLTEAEEEEDPIWL